jgi:hypothetical protein
VPTRLPCCRAQAAKAAAANAPERTTSRAGLVGFGSVVAPLASSGSLATAASRGAAAASSGLLGAAAGPSAASPATPLVGARAGEAPAGTPGSRAFTPSLVMNPTFTGGLADEPSSGSAAPQPGAEASASGAGPVLHRNVLFDEPGAGSGSGSASKASPWSTTGASATLAEGTL